ncbi:hypothetical protein GPZ77_05410 [Streptomyces sp. QHH-9511]|uniref:hypothetical protein n=1 Tax=Streptomyces sp. QHH-9511 TaxID=2684468 RepID=UPI0013182E76|nr:hypothetical protein [Streptomyces sp. QHH-9511]QGZ47895.1 hypothetical protein GPZ77_05410 [Streptomyces sp. QHH-9511]
MTSTTDAAPAPSGPAHGEVETLTAAPDEPGVAASDEGPALPREQAPDRDLATNEGSDSEAPASGTDGTPASDEGPALPPEQASDRGLATDQGPDSEAPASGTDGTPASDEAAAPDGTLASDEPPAPSAPKAGGVVLPPGPARRSPAPYVRAVRLVAEVADTGEVPARRRGVSVTPVRLPLARPTAAPAASPTTRTEEPQP